MQVQIVLQNSVNTKSRQGLKLKPPENLTVDPKAVIVLSQSQDSTVKSSTFTNSGSSASVSS